VDGEARRLPCIHTHRGRSGAWVAVGEGGSVLRDRTCGKDEGGSIVLGGGRGLCVEREACEGGTMQGRCSTGKN
jgi:hypothetical protein